MFFGFKKIVGVIACIFLICLAGLGYRMYRYANDPKPIDFILVRDAYLTSDLTLEARRDGRLVVDKNIVLTNEDRKKVSEIVFSEKRIWSRSRVSFVPTIAVRFGENCLVVQDERLVLNARLGKKLEQTVSQLSVEERDKLLSVLLKETNEREVIPESTLQHRKPSLSITGSSCFILTSVFLKSLLLQTEYSSGSEALSQKNGSEAGADRIRENAPGTIAEARSRARILHETLHGSLQVMHRDFFREKEGMKIPSRSLEDVFKELERSYGVQLHWIAVDLKAMNLDNEPKTEFEKEAVRALKSGKVEFESVSEDEYRFAGRIRLSTTCLGCHAPRRSSNDDRSAGLAITMPLSSEPMENRPSQAP